MEESIEKEDHIVPAENEKIQEKENIFDIPETNLRFEPNTLDVERDNDCIKKLPSNFKSLSEDQNSKSSFELEKTIDSHNKDKALSLVHLPYTENATVQRVSSDSNLNTDKNNFSVKRGKDLDHKSNFVSFDSSTDSYQENARTSSSQSCPINDLESKFLEEQANLKRLLEDVQSKYSELSETVAKKDETIGMLMSTKTLLEKEKQTLKREVEIITREKENAVIRYATVEKSALDAKNAKEVAEKKTRETLKEAENASTRMKIAVTEKTRVSGLFDTKCQELRLSQREIERLKGDAISLETKLKWNTTKLKTETELKIAAEKKVEELTEEINHLKLNEISRAKEEIENEKALITEKQFMEQQATLILLKHGNEEKERKLEIFEKKISTATTDINDLNAKVRQLAAENEALNTEKTKQTQEINDLQLQLDKEVIKVAELQAKVNEIESLRAQLTM